jgi:NMD protein affecting ribosome stability and mRNA decay
MVKCRKCGKEENIDARSGLCARCLRKAWIKLIVSVIVAIGSIVVLVWMFFNFF